MTNLSFRDRLLKDALENFSYQLGVAALAHGDFGEAEELFRRALSVKADHVKAILLLNVILREKGGAPLEESATPKARADAEYDLARAHAIQGRTEMAAAACKRALAHDPNHAAALFDYSYWLRNLGAEHHPAAADLLSRLLALPVDELSLSAGSYVSIGYFLNGVNRIRESGRAADIALSLDPNLLTARHLKGLALQCEDALEEALDLFRQSVDGSVVAAAAGALWAQIASVSEELGRIEDAVAACRQGLTQDGGNLFLHVYLAAALQAGGDFTAAAAALRQAAAPKNPVTLNAQAELAAAQERFDDALESSDLALTAAPGAPFFMMRRADFLALAGRLSEAAALHRQALEKVSNGKFLNHFAATLRLAGETAAAEAAYREAVAVSPRMVWPRLGLTGLLQAQGRLEEALAVIEETVGLHPSLAWGRIYRGSVLAAIGRTQDAREDWRAGLAASLPLGRAFAYFGANREPFDKVAEARRGAALNQ